MQEQFTRRVWQQGRPSGLPWAHGQTFDDCWIKSRWIDVPVEAVEVPFKPWLSVGDIKTRVSGGLSVWAEGMLRASATLVLDGEGGFAWVVAVTPQILRCGSPRWRDILNHAQMRGLKKCRQRVAADILVSPERAKLPGEFLIGMESQLDSQGLYGILEVRDLKLDADAGSPIVPIRYDRNIVFEV